MLGLDVEGAGPLPPNPAPRDPPSILWPSLSRAGHAQSSWLPSDEPRFPDGMVIKERHKRDDAGTHAPAFKSCVSSAVHRVLIVDPYLLCPGRGAEDAVLSWFPVTFEAPEVKIMCGGLRGGGSEATFKTRLADVEAAVNDRKRGTGATASRLQVRFSFDPRAFPFLHDRFAIVDDELWHFGATVGGLHRSVNAATRGWDADGTGATKFFNQSVWNQPAGKWSASICDRSGA